MERLLTPVLLTMVQGISMGNCHKVKEGEYGNVYVNKLAHAQINGKGRSTFVNKLVVLSVNARSLVNKMSELHCLVKDHIPDIICITESWATEEIKISRCVQPATILNWLYFTQSNI